MNDLLTNDEQTDLLDSLGSIIENYMQANLELLPKYISVNFHYFMSG